MLKTEELTCSQAWCLFSSLGQAYAVRLESVSEIISVDRLIQLPLAPPELIGLCTIRRDIVPVVGLVDGRPAVVSGMQGMNALLVLQAEQGIWGIAINREGVAVVEATPEVQELALLPAGPTGTITSAGSIRKGDTAHAIINPEKAWSSVRASVERWYGLIAKAVPVASPQYPLHVGAHFHVAAHSS
ncbi:MAG TPA: chemotaxis protein CheW [Isosphaeraceae bacterium]|jgi:purine-binding chemotaxis protein CheW|nr:chemotaxis protein CheW [Isosphaeraceae bacterium]